MVVSINSTSYKGSDLSNNEELLGNDGEKFPLIPLPIKEAISPDDVCQVSNSLPPFPLIPLPIKEAIKSLLYQAYCSRDVSINSTSYKGSDP